MSRRYIFKRKPRHHQVAALKAVLQAYKSGQNGFALLMEPRTGKTQVAIDAIGALHEYEGVNRVVMIGPLVAIQVWKEELAQVMPYPYRLTVWNRKGRKTSKKASPHGKYELPAYGKNILDIVLINYDAFSAPGAFRVHRSGPNKGQVIEEEGVKLRSKTRGGRYDMIKAFKLWQPELIILDESHRIKNPSAKKSSALHTLGKYADRRMILTGTVVTKSKKLHDVYSQWKFLNPERFLAEDGSPMNLGEFKARYGRFRNMGNYEKWLGNSHEDELHELIHMDAYSVTREECYDLPAMTPQVIHIDLEESAQVYDQMAEDMVARIHTGEITEASIRLVQTLRLQQITSGIAKTSPTPEHPKGRLEIIGAEKLRMIESRLEDLMEADEKVVIGAVFKADIARLEALAKKLRVPCFVIKGGVKQAERDKAPIEFRKVRGGAIFIGQPSAAGEAIDLSAASILQWYSLPSSWVQFKQFSDRIALSDKPTFHEFYLARGTVDEIRYETLLEDGDIGKKMIQSPERLLRLGQVLHN